MKLEEEVKDIDNICGKNQVEEEKKEDSNKENHVEKNYLLDLMGEQNESEKPEKKEVLSNSKLLNTSDNLEE
jgi:hypothetical protein